MAQRALLIGIDDYPFAQLTSCVNDAKAMRDVLIKLGLFREEECTLMISPSGPNREAIPTREHILEWLLECYDADPLLERLLVYFAGHGLSVRLGREADSLRTVLVSAGVTTLKNAGAKLIDFDELIGRFARRGAREQYWIIDACRNLPPDRILPNVATIGWDLPPHDITAEATEMARAVLYAVAPLGQAAAAKGGHGLLTGYLLEGIECSGAAQWGASGWYEEDRGTWLISLESLGDYAKRHIQSAYPGNAWEIEYQLPRVWSGEVKPGPLRDAGALPDRLFGLFVEPAEAASAIAASLSVKRNKVAEWPPRANGEAVPLPPERYRLAAALSPDAHGWQAPRIDNPIVDVREVDRITLRVSATAPAVPYVGLETSPEGITDPLSGAPPVANAAVTETTVTPHFVDDRPRGRFRGGVSFLVTPEWGHYEMPRPTLTVRAIDPGASVRLTRLSGGREQRIEPVNERIPMAEGLWRVEIMLGDEVIAVREEDIASGQDYEVSATAQITPALAALLPHPEQAASEAVTNPRLSYTPSESIGPMQGAILPTLLPMLALKPFDARNAVLQSFSPRLKIPLSAAHSKAPASFAVAFDGPWSGSIPDRANQLTLSAGGTAQRVWQDRSGRVSIFMQNGPRDTDGMRLSLPGWGELDTALPRVDDHCSTVAVTLWQDRRWDLSVSLFVLPPGSDESVRPGRLARALTLAARLYRARAILDDVDYDVFSRIAYGSWGDPVLGALGWFGRFRRLTTAETLTDQARTDFAQRQKGVHDFLVSRVPDLTDTRVIQAVSEETDRENALDALLDDTALGNPVLAEPLAILARHALARNRTEHWSVSRFQQLASEAVFNAIRLN
ncbi:MAG TPA: caspase family protein [Lacipirellulaceae bacterium]|nr:caspase family protein [Lacipirellulaceae bacterium]HWB49052.1 caspase family protein [Stellaceae bacterium]